MRDKSVRALAAGGALLGGFGLALQLAILARNMTGEGADILAVLWRFAGFFTILTNALVVAILSGAAFWPNRRAALNSPRVEMMGTSSILLVGVVYHLLLAHLWNPTGWQLLADVLLHSVTPVMCALFWLLRPHGLLKWRDALVCMIWPLGYCFYALARGAVDRWYAYPFLNPSTQSPVELVISIASIALGFALGALALIGLDRVLSGLQAKAA